MQWSKKLGISCGGIELETPVVVASGVWPFETEFWDRRSFPGLGAICTKAVTLHQRNGNPGIRVWETPSGMLNSIGLQNGGVDLFLEHHLPEISQGGIPFIVNVAMEKIHETGRVLEELERYRSSIPAVELNISCPNVSEGGMAWGTDALSSSKAVAMAREKWSGPLWVKLTPQAGNISSVALAVQDQGADALVVGNTWLGMAMDVEKGKPVFDRVFAGLSGPAIFPLALRTLWEVCSSVSIPVVGCGGITSPEDCLAMIMAGATAVEIGTVMFTHLDAGSMICSGIEEYLEARGLDDIKDILGIARS